MSSGSEEVRISACATPVRGDAVAGGTETIATTVTVTLLGVPVAGEPLAIDAPRGALLPRQCFSARYLTREGARRVLLRTLTAEPRPRMRDDVIVVPLSEAGPAPERGAYREPIGLRLHGRIKRSARLREGFPVNVEVVNASTSGLCLDTTASLRQGDAVWLDAPPNPELEGTSVEVVRRDPVHTTRFGARFEEPAEGVRLFSVLVAAARERRARQPRATPPARPAPPRENGRGMHTRRRDGGR